MGSKVAVAAGTVPRAVATSVPTWAPGTTTCQTRHRPPTSAASRPVQSPLVSTSPCFYYISIYFITAFNFRDSILLFEILSHACFAYRLRATDRLVLVSLHVREVVLSACKTCVP